MALTLAVFSAVQIATPLWIARTCCRRRDDRRDRGRPRDNQRSRRPSRANRHCRPRPARRLDLSSEGVNAAGQPVSAIPAACEPVVSQTLGSHRGITPGPGNAPLNNCVASHGIRVAESYQPASHYWPLQWSETGMFLALALALACYCFWRLNRRRS